MSNHQKRLSVPKSWPVERKTAVFTVKAGAGPHGRDGVPLLILLRDVLGYVDTKKEARYALNQGNILINGEAISDEQRPVGMFDIVAFLERDEHYRVFPEEGGRLALTPIEAENAESKLAKITNKSTVSGGKTQLNLHDGSNILVDDANEYASNDSIVVSTDDKEVVAHFVYEEGSLVTAVSGQHAGEIGEITDIEVTPGSSANNVIVKRSSTSSQTESDDIVETDEDEFETIQDYVVVIDENFVGDEE